MENQEMSNEKLDEILELQKGNNKMLKKVLNHQKMANLMKLLYWVVLIGITYGVFSYFKPQMENLKSIYLNGNAAIEKLNNF